MARKTDIRLRRSNTAGAIPSGSHLNEGELAINTADGALYFKKSDSTVITAHDNTIMHIDSANDRIGIGTTSPNRTLDVHGSIALQNDSYYNGTYDWMFNQDSSNGRLAISYYGTERVSIKDDGKVGIGTDSPDEKLEVSGGVTSNFYAFNTAFSGSPSDSVYVVAPRSSNLGLFTASTERLTIDGSGNVGIGTTSPDVKLHLEDSSRVDIKFEKTGSETHYIRKDGNYLRFRGHDDSTVLFELKNNTDGSNAASFPNGSVGIGTTSPDFKLDVAGDGRFYGQNNLLYLDSGTTGSPQIQLRQGTTRRSYLRFENSRTAFDLVNEYGGISFWTGVSGSEIERIQIDTTGHLTFVGDNRHIYFGGSNTFIGENSNTNKLELRGGGSNTAATVYIDNTGQMGLGTSTPGAKLHVTGGDILIDNNNSLSFENAAGAKRDILTYNSSNKVRLDNPGGSTVDLNSDTLIVHRHGRIVTGKAGQTWTNGYSRNISIQNITDSTNNGFGVWNAFIGTNLRYDTTNNTFVRASDQSNSNWGNIAAQFFNGAAGNTDPAIDWVTDIPNDSVTDASEVNVSGSTLVGLSKMTLTSGGSLGIGTRSPAAKLHVNSGTDNNVARFESSDGEAVITLKDNTGSAAIANIGDSLYFKTSSSQTNRMTILSNGRVGIGTTSPADELHVDGSGDTTVRITTTSTTAEPKLVFVDGSGDYSSLEKVNRDIKIKAFNTDVAYFSNSGRVGIGTSSPDANLDIESDLPTIRLTETDDSTYSEISQSFGYLTINNDAGNSGSGDAIIFKVDNSEKVRFESGGSVLIGNSTNLSDANADDLQVGNTTGAHGISIISQNSHNGNLFFGDNDNNDAGRVSYNHTNNRMEFYTNRTQRLVIDSNGNTIFGGTSVGAAGAMSVKVDGSYTDLYLYGAGTSQGGRIFFGDSSDRSSIVGTYGSGGGGKLSFKTDTTGGTSLDRLVIDSDGSIRFNNAYTFPTSIGSAGQILKVPSSGTNLIWANDAGGGSATVLTDTDGDTKIQVEESVDEDVIRFDVAGSEIATMTDDGVILNDGYNFEGDVVGAIKFKAKAGEALSKGDVVYISGISGNTTVVSKADADDSSKMPAFGVAASTVSLNAAVEIVTFGTLLGVDTSTPNYSEGDELYVSTTAGAMTNSAPTGSGSLLQKIAKVTRVDASAGSIKVSGAGRTNATPNLDEGKLFVGNSSNQAVQGDDTLYVDMANSRVGINTSSPGSTLDVAGQVEIDTTNPMLTFKGDDGIWYRARVDEGNNRLELGHSSNKNLYLSNSGNSIFNYNLTVTGDLTVQGTTTTLNTATLDVEDKNITLNYGSGDTSSSADGAGITIQDAVNSSTDATILWNASSDQFDFSHHIKVPDSKYLKMGDDNDFIIYHDGTTNYIQAVKQDSDIIFRGNDGGTNFNAMAIDMSAGGLVGIGTTSPGELLELNSDGSDADGAVLLLKHANNNSTDVISTIKFANNAGTAAMIQAGTTGANNTSYINFFTENSGTSSEKMRILANGNVGIGTTSPSTNLSIVDGGSHNNSDGNNRLMIDTNGHSYILLNSPNDYDQGIHFRNNTDGSNVGRIAYRHRTGGDDLQFTVGGTVKATLTSTGRLGIGTTTPVRDLQINKSVSGGQVRAEVFNSSDTANSHGIVSIYSGGASAGDAFLHYKINGVGDWSAGIDNSDSDKYKISRNFGPGLNDYIVIDTTGNVGIGTTSPAEKLDVNGSVAARETGAGNGFLLHTNSGITANNNLMQFWSGQSSGLSFHTNSTGDGSNQRMTITSAGQVGIGTSSPDKSLHVYHATTDYVARFESGDNQGGIVLTDATSSSAIKTQNGTLQLIADSTDQVGSSAIIFRMDNLNSGEIARFDVNGQLGIGTTSPSHKLHVNGGALFNTNTGTDPVYITRSGATDQALKIYTDDANVIFESIQDESLDNYGGFVFSMDSGTTEPFFDIRKGTSSGGTKFRVDGSGDIGIGTTTLNSYSNQRVVTINGTTHSRIDFETGGTLRGSVYGDSGSLNLDAGGNYIRFYTGNTEKMRLKSNGFLGIGTDTPLDLIHIKSTSTDARQVIDAHTGYDAELKFAENGTVAYTIGHNAADDTFRIGTTNVDTSPRFVIDSTGNVGINENPRFKLSVKTPAIPSGSTYAWPFDLSRPNTTIRGLTFGLGASGTTNAIAGHNADVSIGHTYGTDSNGLPQYYETLRVKHIDQAVGNVGIGVTDPKAKFQVEEYGIDTSSTTTTATTQVAIHAFPIADFRTARFTIQITNTTDSTYHSTEIIAVHDGTTANITEFGEVHTGSSVEATFDADINSNNFRLLATPTSTNSMTFKVVCHSITV